MHKKKSPTTSPRVSSEGSQKTRFITTFILSCIFHDFVIEYAEVSSVSHTSLGDIV